MSVRERITLPLSGAEKRFPHHISSLIFQIHLRMAVGAFQERGVCVAYQLGHSLLIHPVVEQGCDEEMPQSVQVEAVWEANLPVDLPQMLGEGIRVDRLALLICEKIRAMFGVALFLTLSLDAVISQQK